MDVVFINGGILWNVLIRYIGPYKLAHWIRKHGYTCQVIDFADRVSKDLLSKALFKYVTAETKALCISTTFITTNTYKWSNGKTAGIPEHIIELVKECKEKYPKLKVIIGGYMSEKLTGWGVTDASIMNYHGSSEEILTEYLDHITKGTPAPYGNWIVPRGANRGHGRMHYDRPRNPSYNIETDDFHFVKDDCILPGEPLPLDVSRGCIFACRFCQYPHLGKKKLDYIRGMDYIEDEMRYNNENFGTTGYYVLDDTFNDTEWKMQEWYNMTQRLGFKINYTAFIRADLVHRFQDTAHMMFESGLSGSFHGIETFHPSASKIVGKGWSGQHAMEFLPRLHHDIWKRQVGTHQSHIVGITTDTEENIDNTIKWFIDNDMHSIRFQRLGLYGPTADKNKRTIQSEFDMNAEKYGFTILDKGSDNVDKDWYNDNWTKSTARQVARRAKLATDPIIKYGAWRTPVMRWYGFDQHTIMNTYIKDWDFDLVKMITKEKFIQYFTMLITKQ